MSSSSIASYFTVRKRAATDDIVNAKNKVIRLESGSESSNRAQALVERAILAKQKIANDTNDSAELISTKIASPSTQTLKAPPEKRIRRNAKRTATASNASNKVEAKQQKIVKFTLGGSLSPRKNIKSSPAKQFNPIEKNSDDKTPTKNVNVNKANIVNKNLTNVRKELSFDEIKSKIGRSSRLNDLKAILNKQQQLEEQYQACINKRNAKQKANHSPAKLEGQSLKKFDTIELEVLSSPQKGLRTPTKTPFKSPIKEPASAEKSFSHDDLMSPKKPSTPRRLFSPTKNTVPAYQRFQNLASESVSSSLQLPFKYRNLLELFRCIDTVCAMFYNRKETITFKKLQPTVQRMIRKNLMENHLAQINYLDPDAFTFEQRKMLNPGSHTKYDYYQLVITPNVDSISVGPNDEVGIQKLDDDNIIRKADTKTMNPQIITARYHRFQQILLDRVKQEHDLFLRNLQPPIIIAKEKIRRWHHDFDLEACPDILPGELPQPPNIEKFSSAKDILSTARNLFNCATTNERIMEQYERKLSENPSTSSTSSQAQTPIDDPVAKVLKSVPKSLLDKIRAKQAAKQLDAMTRRPSQDAEASKYARLPELARYIRNIFVTENKGVLELDKVLSKLENSFREKLTREQLRELLELMSKEAPRNWLTFHFIRKTDFIKINRHENLAEVIKELERKAQQKAD